MKKITFIGLGHMGTAIVERLLQHDYEITVFNRTQAKAAPLIALGAKSSDSIAQAVEGADVVMTSLLNDEAVLFVTEKMIPYLTENTIHIGLSTILPTTAETLLNLHQQGNSNYISAVVLGVAPVARRGELTAFFAGKENYHDEVVALLSTFSAHVTCLGGQHAIKSPNIMKICMNYSLATALELISELYIFAEKSGLDVDVLKNALHQIFGLPSFKLYIDKIHARNFDEVNSSMVAGKKDITVFQEAFSQVGVSPELGNILKSRFISALAQGMEDKDWSGVYEVIRKEAGLA